MWRSQTIPLILKVPLPQEKWVSPHFLQLVQASSFHCPVASLVTLYGPPRPCFHPEKILLAQMANCQSHRCLGLGPWLLPVPPHPHHLGR